MPGASPRRPTPRAGAAEQTVANASLRPTPKVVSAGHVHYAGLIAIPVEHLRAPRKKAGVGDNVVLEHDGLGKLAERQIESRGNSRITAHVRFCKVAHH